MLPSFFQSYIFRLAAYTQSSITLYLFRQASYIQISIKSFRHVSVSILQAKHESTLVPNLLHPVAEKTRVQRDYKTSTTRTTSTTSTAAEASTNHISSWNTRLLQDCHVHHTTHHFWSWRPTAPFVYA
jgi:hypothetical protein